MKSTRKRSLLDKFYNKISKIHLYYDSVLSSFFFASILILWSNSFAVARLVMQYITLEGYLVGTMHIIGVLILAILILFILLYICSLFSQKLFRLTTFILLSICGSYNYFVYKNNFIFNESMVESIILAGWDDATAVYGHDIILFLTIFIGSPAIKLFFLKVKKSTLMQSTFKFSKFCIILSGLILILNHQSLKHPKTLLTARNNLMPFPLLYPSHDLKRRTQHAWDLRFKNASEGRLNDYEGINFTKTKNNTEPVIAIFLIGESTRSDRLSINGYEKETTPLMQKTPNLFAFKDVLTCGIVTSDSVPCMLTDISSHNFQNHHVKVVDRTSLASPLTKVGFDSYWYSLQYRISMENYGKKFSGTKHYIGHDEIISRQASIGEDNYNDQIVIPILEKNVKQDTVYMIHLRGSHAKYSQKYGREHAKFQPDLGDDDISTSNAYNNTIVYLDEMVNKLVEKFKDRNAFIFYVSDHGESLGVDGNGFRAHGCCAKVEDAPTQQKHVPMILWMSDKFASHNPEKFNNVKKLFQNREKLHLTHDNVFHSFLDCLNVKSEIINKELSLCSGLKKTTK